MCISTNIYQVTLHLYTLTSIICLYVTDGCSQAPLATPVIERVYAQFQRLLDVVSKGEFPEKGQRLLSKLSTSLSSSFADTDVSIQGRELNWSAPDISQNLLQVSTASLAYLVAANQGFPTH